MYRNERTVLVLGGDGYLGWTLGLALACRTNRKVILADNLIKRQWEKKVRAKLLVPFKKPEERINAYTAIFGKSNLLFEKIELLDSKAVARIIKKHKPYAIINAAQQPSAPFAMMNAENAAATFSNNVIGHLNVLWAIAEIDKNIRYIKLGSAGCYMGVDTDFVPLEKVNFEFTHQGKAHKIFESWLPMQARDFYHQSKISDFLINDLCADMWNLRVLTVQQSTIFGATIEENLDTTHHALSTRFNYDAVFGTVLNRFVCQLAIGHPLTVYGDGEQATGLISLSDTVDNFMKFCEVDVRRGDHVVIHNYTHRLSVKNIAKLLTQAAGASKIKFIKNPRKEGTCVLSKEVSVHHMIQEKHVNKEEKLKKELQVLMNFAKLYRNNIDTSIIIPKVNWEK